MTTKIAESQPVVVPNLSILKYGNTCPKKMVPNRLYYKYGNTADFPNRALRAAKILIWQVLRSY